MINWGIMGAGIISADFCAGARLVPDTKVLAIGSKSPERAKAFAEKEGIELALSYDELLANKDIDAVYIGTTNNFHYENIKACLNAGKHVLCEKPMVMTVAEAKEVVSLAKEKGLFLMEAMWARYLPKTKMVRKWISEDKIGKPVFVQSTIGYQAKKDYSWRLYNKELGGGVMYDIGVYIIDLIPYFVFDDIKNITGKVSLAPTGVDESVTLDIEMENCSAQAFMTFAGAVSEEATIHCERGYIKLPHIHWGRDAYLYDEGGNLIEEFKGSWDAGMQHEILAANTAIINGLLEESECPHSMTIKNAEIYEKILK